MHSINKHKYYKRKDTNLFKKISHREKDAKNTRTTIPASILLYIQIEKFTAQLFETEYNIHKYKQIYMFVRI